MYQKMYYLLFNAITNAIEEIRNRNYGNAETALVKAQQAAEELYLSYGDDEEKRHSAHSAE